MSDDFRYIVLTPIAPHKRYSLDRFLKAVSEFDPLPDKMVFCCEPEDVFEISEKRSMLSKLGIELVVFTIGPDTMTDYEMTELGRIRDSRNILRSFFLRSEYDWALLLDSDIIVEEKKTPSILFDVAQREKCLTVINQYPGRESDSHPWNGVALSLMHRTAANLTEFQLAPIVWEGKEIGRLSEDFTYLSILRSGSSHIERITGWKSFIIGRFIPVIHEIDSGVDKKLEKEG